MSLSDNPMMKRSAQRGGSGHGTASEKRVAKALGARLNPNSGAMASAKGDAKLKAKFDFRIESKATVNDGLRLELGWLVKISHEALSVGAYPALTVSFVLPEGQVRPAGDWVMVPAHVFKELVSE